MNDVTIYHNPRCSKSRQTLDLLRDHDLGIEVVEYLKTPPDLQTLRSIHAKLDCDARAMLRSKEEEYKQAGLDSNSADQEIFEAIAAYPKLLERPIVVRGDRAVIARPPETVLDLL